MAAALMVAGCQDQVPPQAAQVKPTPQAPVVAPPPIKQEPLKPTGPQPLLGVGAQPDLVKVALLAPLSGPQAGLGQSLANAAELAVSDMGGDAFALLPVDTAGPGGAHVAAQNALAQGATLLLGPVFAADVQAAAPVAQAAGTPVLSFSSDLTVAAPGVNVLGFLPRQQAARVAQYAVSQGIKRFAILAPDTGYGHLMADAFKTALAGPQGTNPQGADVARTAFYGLDVTRLPYVVSTLSDYESRKKAWAAANPTMAPPPPPPGQKPPPPGTVVFAEAIGQVPFEALFIPEGGQRLHQLLALLKQENVDLSHVRLLGPMLWDDADAQGDPLLAGGWYPAPAPEAQGKFQDRYQKLFGAKPPAIAGLGYDAASLAAVLAKGGGPQPFTAANLTKDSGFAGTNGLFRLLPDGSVERGLAVVEIRAPKPAVVSPAPDAFAPIAPSTATPTN